MVDLFLTWLYVYLFVF